MVSEAVASYIQTYGLIAVFVFMFSNGILSTPPSETTLALAGVLAASGYHSLVVVTMVAVCGNISGALLLYWIGRTVGQSWVQRFRNFALKKGIPRTLVDVVFPEARLVSALADRLSVKGGFWIGSLRCLPMVRSIVSLPAGMAKMPLLLFVSCSILGMTIWALLWESLGYFLGANWQRLGGRIRLGLFLLLFLLLLEIVRQMTKRFRKSLNQQRDS